MAGAEWGREKRNEKKKAMRQKLKQGTFGVFFNPLNTKI